MNAVTLNLDIQFPDRMYELKFAVGTQPLVRVYLKANGTAVTTTGYTGQMVFAEFKDSESAVYIDSTATGSNYIDFQLTATETLQISSGTEEYFLQFLITDGSGNTAEWNRGKLFLRASPGTDGADVATLGTSINWANYSSYANTGASGPYRAGTNVTFSNNGDGSVNIAAASATVADGDKGDITVSASGATWTIDNAAVTLAKMAHLAQGELIGRHATGTGTPQAITIDGGLELNGANLRRAALTGDVTASAGSNATTLANTAVTAGSYGPATLTVDAKGRLTAASTTSSAAIQSALGSVYLPLAGGTLTGELIAAEATFSSDVQILGAFSASASGLTGDIPAGAFGELCIEWDSRDLNGPETSGEVGWTAYTVDTATRTFRAEALTSANTSAQTFTVSTGLRKVPRGFTAFKTTGAIVIEWIADDLTVADITGIELIGYSDVTGSKTTLYTDSTVRNVSSINVPVVVSINRSAFSSTTVPTHLLLEISGSIEDGKKMAILHMEVVSE